MQIFGIGSSRNSTEFQQIEWSGVEGIFVRIGSTTLVIKLKKLDIIKYFFKTH